ncbi:FAD binding domain-containing protein [Thermorudis peleae]|uniref:FAD binding domain-containing protein n=1 Tax=Thermorudis peleae TaxID=1382356 RepID=UPI00068D30B3|nr:FAD binding domain-containing protein [Thermorudis peleae]
MLWQHYYRPTTLTDALTLLDTLQGQARLVAGGTDVLVELRRGIRPTTTLIDLTALSELRFIREENGTLVLGALTTHNDVIASPLCIERAFPLAQACWEVGAPAIRTRATVAGNIVTASPANDTITPLVALDAAVVLTSLQHERVVPLREFYTGVRKTVLAPNELVREIRIPALRPTQRGIFLKLGLRRAQAISVVNVAIVLTFDGAHIAESALALGSVAPTIIRARSAEAFLRGRALTPETIDQAAQLASQDAAPIDDIRGSARYRHTAVAALVRQGLEQLAIGQERQGWPTRPVLLEIPTPSPAIVPFNGTIHVTINGQPTVLPPSAATKPLLDALREDAGLTGAKEGCAEGECGACTVWLNGQAVMSCLVPAPQAHGGEIVTIEGLAGTRPSPTGLHPVQAAFIEHGAVQCGFCIPGMLMASAMLLEERPQPTPDEVRVALSGNICRCTGYRKIVDAVLAAGGVACPK